ncbi:MAG: nidogen-like domain-containing protein [Prochlorotrichaceae cyanobacterium]
MKFGPLASFVCLCISLGVKPAFPLAYTGNPLDYTGTGHFLVNNLGGTQGFGEYAQPGVDDTSWQIDVSSVFESGFNYFGSTYSGSTGLYIGSNGYITFGTGLSGYDPSGISGSTTPIIALHYTDVDTAKTTASYDPTGNSTGTNKIYYDLDPINDVVTITFDDVWPYSGTPSNANAYQVRFWDFDDGDFGIEFRYEDLVWGRSGTSAYGTAGWSAGDLTNYAEVPGSGTIDIESIETASNIGQPGVFFWTVQGGTIPNPNPVPLEVDGTIGLGTLALLWLIQKFRLQQS